jgi:hypothetical protein
MLFIFLSRLLMHFLLKWVFTTFLCFSDIFPKNLQKDNLIFKHHISSSSSTVATNKQLINDLMLLYRFSYCRLLMHLQLKYFLYHNLLIKLKRPNIRLYLFNYYLSHAGCFTFATYLILDFFF